MDTLTTHDYLADQRRFVAGTPAIGMARRFLRAALEREMSAAGLRLARRIVAAILAGTEELKPATGAPVAHQTIYGTFRRAAHMAGLRLDAQLDAGAAGDDSPILTSAAADALAELEAVDMLAPPASGLAEPLAVVLSGYSWRLP